jgi:hypothetical protein
MAITKFITALKSSRQINNTNKKPRIQTKTYLTLNPFPERKGLFHLSFREGADGRSIFNLSRYMMNVD